MPASEPTGHIAESGCLVPARGSIGNRETDNTKTDSSSSD